MLCTALQNKDRAVSISYVIAVLLLCDPYGSVVDHHKTQISMNSIYGFASEWVTQRTCSIRLPLAFEKRGSEEETWFRQPQTRGNARFLWSKRSRPLQQFWESATRTRLPHFEVNTRFSKCMLIWKTNFHPVRGARRSCALPMRVPNSNPVLDRTLATGFCPTLRLGSEEIESKMWVWPPNCPLEAPPSPPLHLEHPSLKPQPFPPHPPPVYGWKRYDFANCSYSGMEHFWDPKKVSRYIFSEKVWSSLRGRWLPARLVLSGIFCAFQHKNDGFQYDNHLRENAKMCTVSTPERPFAENVVQNGRKTTFLSKKSLRSVVRTPICQIVPVSRAYLYPPFPLPPTPWLSLRCSKKGRPGLARGRVLGRGWGGGRGGPPKQHLGPDPHLGFVEHFHSPILYHWIFFTANLVPQNFIFVIDVMALHQKFIRSGPPQTTQYNSPPVFDVIENASIHNYLFPDLSNENTIWWYLTNFSLRLSHMQCAQFSTPVWIASTASFQPWRGREALTEASCLSRVGSCTPNVLDVLRLLLEHQRYCEPSGLKILCDVITIEFVHYVWYSPRIFVCSCCPHQNDYNLYSRPIKKFNCKCNFCKVNKQIPGKVLNCNFLVFFLQGKGFFSARKVFFCQGKVFFFARKRFFFLVQGKGFFVQTGKFEYAMCGFVFGGGGVYTREMGIICLFGVFSPVLWSKLATSL